MKNIFLINMRAIALGLSLGLFLIGTTQAALVTTTVSGVVEFADTSNPFSLAVNDSVTAVATYDNAGILLMGASEIVVNSVANPLLALTMTFGNHTVSETDDIDFTFGAPILLFTNGLLSGIDFIQIFGAGDSLELGSIGDLFFLDEVVSVGISAVLLEGTWDFDNATTVPVNTTPVTEPSIMLLLSIGLLGFLTRRRALNV